jgi:hypothetical protein
LCEFLGVILYMEIQEGKEPMRKIMRDVHNMKHNRVGDNAGAAVAVRLVAGCHGIEMVER